ncbi:hypothetical protein CGLAMM_01300 [Acetobacteraceae bacterium EV16G]|uniref:Uncharacterized protein n=1 Tax=Sorlinia euscelidii TaxID=3081148 RepID=A0ABU7U1Q1_9PROT
MTETFRQTTMKDRFLSLLQKLDDTASESGDDSSSADLFSDFARVAIELVKEYDSNRIMLGLLESSYTGEIARQSLEIPQGVEREAYVDSILDRSFSDLFHIVATSTSDNRDGDLEKRLNAQAEAIRSLTHRKSDQLSCSDQSTS